MMGDAIERGRERIGDKIAETKHALDTIGEMASDEMGVSEALGRATAYAGVSALTYSVVAVQSAVAQPGSFASGVSNGYIGPMDVMMAPMQLDQVGEAFCGTGFGELVSLAFAALAIFYIYKGVVALSRSRELQKSTDRDKQEEGRQKAKEAKGNGEALGVLVIAPILLEMVGIHTLSCITIDAGILGGGSAVMAPAMDIALAFL